MSKARDVGVEASIIPVFGCCFFFRIFPKYALTQRAAFEEELLIP